MDYGGCGGSSVWIYINGIKDIGGINFNKLTIVDIMKYYFPDLIVAFTFYNWYARMHGFSACKNKVMRTSMYWKDAVDKEGRLEHLLWCDRKKQLDYSI